MTSTTAALARTITWKGSKQSYFIARLLVDKDLEDDCYRAYAYFRWADDLADDTSSPRAGRIAFVQRQRALIEGLYSGKRPGRLSPEEAIIAGLICNDRGENSGLRSFIENFLAAIEFDVWREGRLISQDELRYYTNRLGVAVTNAIQYFIGNGHAHPQDEHRYAAAKGAHITHMLRDMREDLRAGFINIPREYVEERGLDPEDVDNPIVRDWVRGQVEAAREQFRLGKCYIDKLEVLRCKIAAHLYISRFEVVLDTIEHDGYFLRSSYRERHRLSAWLRMTWVGIRVAVGHLAKRIPGSNYRRSIRLEKTRRPEIGLPGS
ncbi:MAG: squalene/phytoene synthase family protein [Thermoplasmata archaeon]